MKIKKFNKMAKYRLNVLKELLSTEQKFVDDLKLIIEEVKNPLEN